jgi:hypothetical protein
MQAPRDASVWLALWTNTERVKYTGIEVVDDCFVEQSGSP